MSNSQEILKTDSQETNMSVSQDAPNLNSQKTVQSQETQMSDSQETQMPDSQETQMFDLQKITVSEDVKLSDSSLNVIVPNCGIASIAKEGTSADFNHVDSCISQSLLPAVVTSISNDNTPCSSSHAVMTHAESDPMPRVVAGANSEEFQSLLVTTYVADSSDREAQDAGMTGTDQIQPTPMVVTEADSEESQSLLVTEVNDTVVQDAAMTVIEYEATPTAGADLEESQSLLVTKVADSVTVSCETTSCGSSSQDPVMMHDVPVMTHPEGDPTPMVVAGADSEESQSLLVMKSADIVAISCVSDNGNQLADLGDLKMNEDIKDTSASQPNKKRRVQMDTQQCMDHMQTETGAKALVNPVSVKFSSKDPNRGLYPRNLSKSFGANSGFVPASSLNQVNLVEPVPQPNSSQSSSVVDFTIANSYYGSKKKIPPQSQKNSITNYFSKEDVKQGSSDMNESDPGSKLIEMSESEKKNEDSTGENSKTGNAFTTLSLMAGQKFKLAPSSKKGTKAKGKKRGVSSKKTSGSSFTWKQSAKVDMIDLTEDCSSDDSLDAAMSEGNCYGMIGDVMKNYRSPTKPKREAQRRMEDLDCFSILPVHVIENIFSQLPMLDLCLNSNRVSLMWNEIISDEKFVPWKKKYHKLKKNVGETKQVVEDLMKENGMAHPTDFLVGLIRYMKEFKLTTAKNMTSCLKRHPKYFWAEDIMKERIEDCIDDGEPNPWCVVALLVILSEDVLDVSNIINNLLAPLSECTAIEVLECLYCIATFLFAFTMVRRHAVWHGMHYRVYYALYLHENSSVTNVGQLENAFTNYKGQQTIMRYQNANSDLRMTHEQLRIVNHNVLPGQIIKIVAFAGTGKTTTLIQYTQARPSQRFLLVVFNKAVQEQAKTQFPANVECRTSHSLAYRMFGWRYKNANKLHPWGLKVYSVAMGLPKREGSGNQFVRAKFVLDTLQTFLASADEFVTSAHAPVERMDDKSGERKAILHEEKMNYASDAEFIWKKMVDLKDKKFSMTHDGYLKLFQLSKPKLDEYDCILVDEAQDLTPAVANIFLTQPQAKILVGDPRQQIYAFRGAVNAMANVEATKIFYLTQSFRFGPEIAYVANCCMDTLHGERQKTLVGNGIPGGVKGESVGQIAIITRTNFHLFGEAVKLCCHCPDPVKVAFIGGTDNFGFNMILDIHALLMPEHERHKHRAIQNNFIKHFKSFIELEKYAEKTLDSELMGKIKIAKSYQKDLPTLIKQILAKCVKDSDFAEVVFTTAHKAKGLEFSTVKLTDDFVGLPQGSITRQLMNVSQDEGNLLYVAVTRAKKRLYLTDTLLALLKLCGERFDYPKHTSLVQKDEKPIKSFQTGTEFEPGVVCLVRSELKKSNSCQVHGGVWSPELIQQDHLEFAQLLGRLQIEED